VNTTIENRWHHRNQFGSTRKEEIERQMQRNQYLHALVLKWIPVRIVVLFRGQASPVLPGFPSAPWRNTPDPVSRRSLRSGIAFGKIKAMTGAKRILLAKEAKSAA
jgi:hypothetical protein